ncbi:LOW QUALITY PROTEIN: cell division cycle protein 27 homolog [Anopheles stephensi]|uniref:LOW QUALITY PROTEIN: cell division cycle protein 27 homolog n=1 Tax=Anopheles stephensi TaxID=30069 RepID=UPI0016589D72|nr:LOW QUALITY PROTEIN: cell division cycle protein 27 homolog [Anopheles stephensi]
MIVQEPVQAAIWHCLNHYHYQDATFLAERLCAEVDSEESVFLLATCYYRAGQKHLAHWLLSKKSVRSTQCRFLLSKCAFDLKKYSEAENALINDDHLRPRHLDEIVKEFGDIACFALELVSKICLKTERSKLANDASRRAIKLNPFLWQSFADLCSRGEKPDPDSVFQLTSTDIFQTSQAHHYNSIVWFGGTGGYHNGPLDSSVGANDCTTDQMGESVDNPSTPVDQCFTQNVNTPNNQQPPVAPPGMGHVPQQQQQQQNLNYSYFNSSVGSMRLGGANVSAGDQTPTANVFTEHNNTPFRKQQFKYLSAISPSTPSFGVLPIVHTPNEPIAFLITPSPQLVPMGTPVGQTGATTVIQQQGSQFMQFATGMQQTPQQQQQQQQQQQNQGIIGDGTLADPHAVAPNRKIALLSSNKKMRRHHHNNLGTMGNIINRKHDSPHHPQQAAIQLLQQQSTNTKPIVFSQTGNQLTTTPRTPNTTGGALQHGQNVRRSSRLFSNSNSVKENAKSPQLNNKFVAPRSPPRRTKQRISKTINNSVTTLLENIPEKKSSSVCGPGADAPVKEKIETITSTVNDNGSSPLLNDKVMLNNSINSAQKIAQQVLQLKKQSADGLMTLLRELGHGFLRLQNYECEKAIEHFSNVPLHHHESSWVKSMIALAHHEMRDYESAVHIFHDIHEREPHRLQYMEIYSTDLWHLQKDVVLSSLAQDLMAQDKTSPITWCVAGNCFSAHKEHETAIKFFFRAIQVDEDFAYSYALLGHELVMTEELEKALSMYRLAVLHDPRHYNAWFGIGTVFCKQERHELAELHYRRALQINPRNSVIMVHIAVMQFFLRKTDQAIRTLNAAIAIDPRNPQCKFQRGSMFFMMGRYHEALKELDELKQIVPKEAMVYYLMGKIHKKLGNVDLALMHLSWATDLGSKGANNQIKDNFDSIIRTQDGDGGMDGDGGLVGGAGGGESSRAGDSGAGATGSAGGTAHDGDGDAVDDKIGSVGSLDPEAGSSSIDPDYSLGIEQISSDDSTAAVSMRNESLDIIANNFYDSDSY